MARILIVDDSPSQMANQKKILESAGHTVLTASNGEQGISIAKAEQPDIVLMDVVMPEMNGFQATRKLSHDAETKDIPIILVTTKDQQTDKVWGERQGAKGYVVKPVVESELLNTINGLLG